MIRIDCISLADQPERRAYMRQQFEHYQLPYRFFDAIRIAPGSDWPAIYDRKQRLAHSGIDLRPGEMGCYLSHRAVWAEFLAGDDALCLVLEDDVGLSPDFTGVVEALCAAQADWDVVRLFAMFRKPAFPVRPLTGPYVLVDYLAQPNGTQGYLINRDAAERLLHHTARMSVAIDTALDRDWEHGVQIRGIEPAVLTHDDSFGTTLGTAQKTPLSPLRKLVREVNRIGTGLRKQLWLLRKKKRLQSSTRD
ncbi:MAG: glycosyltransferase family 25 protein [Oxalobacteraceae bacterium]|nr:glycosyltransferase family 25 protein [Oxalobacteraceae bacterium]